MILLIITILILLSCVIALVYFLLSIRKSPNVSNTLGPLQLMPAPTPVPTPTPAPAIAPTPAPTPTLTAPMAPTAPTAPIAGWAPYKNRLPNEDVNSWSYRIYNAITSNAAAAEDRYTG